MLNVVDRSPRWLDEGLETAPTAHPDLDRQVANVRQGTDPIAFVPTIAAMDPMDHVVTVPGHHKGLALTVPGLVETGLVETGLVEMDLALTVRVEMDLDHPKVFVDHGLMDHGLMDHGPMALEVKVPGQTVHEVIAGPDLMAPDRMALDLTGHPANAGPDLMARAQVVPVVLVRHFDF